jgi:hypothetical protein
MERKPLSNGKTGLAKLRYKVILIFQLRWSRNRQGSTTVCSIVCIYKAE